MCALEFFIASFLCSLSTGLFDVRLHPRLVEQRLFWPVEAKEDFKPSARVSSGPSCSLARQAPSDRNRHAPNRPDGIDVVPDIRGEGLWAGYPWLGAWTVRGWPWAARAAVAPGYGHRPL